MPAVARMEARWEGLETRNARVDARAPSRAFLERAKPAIFGEDSRKGTDAHMRNVSQEKRSAIGHKVANTRRRNPREHERAAKKPELKT
jgi:hypothetical protein